MDNNIFLQTYTFKNALVQHNTINPCTIAIHPFKTRSPQILLPTISSLQSRNFWVMSFSFLSTLQPILDMLQAMN